MTLQARTLGYAVDVVSPAGGFVHSVFLQALNLIVGDDLWTVVGTHGGDLPFGVRVTCDDFCALGLLPGDLVAVRAGYIGIGEHRSRVVIDGRAAPSWSPAPRPPMRAGLRERLDAVAGTARGRSWPTSQRMARDVVAALGDPPTLLSVLGRVIGRGPGLTPAGDDVVVGVLAALKSEWAEETGQQAAHRVNKTVEGLRSGTTDISAHLLRQAGNGQQSRAVDNLLVALASATTDEELLAAAENLLRIGATSGADTTMGVLEAARVFLPLHEKALV